MNKLGLLAAVNREKGYSLNLKLSTDELEIIRKMIRIQWLYRLQLLVPRNLYQFDEMGIERYHELSHLIDHENAWVKHARVLPQEAIAIIRNMDFFKKLEREFGQVGIGDEEYFKRENMSWRLVRPGNKDIGSIHADKWFWDIGTYGY